MAHVELSIEERHQIERLRLSRTPVARVAARLRRHRSMVYRELWRNRVRDEELLELDGCWSLVAHEMATRRRRAPDGRAAHAADHASHRSEL